MSTQMNPMHKQLEAYAEARGESLPEMLAGFTRSLELRLTASSWDAEPTRHPVSEELAHAAFAYLPTSTEIARSASTRVVELKAELLTLHAYTCDVVGDIRVFVGVATFPDEPPDLTRQRSFVLLRINRETHFMTLDAFLRVFEARSETERSFRVESIRVRELPEGCACFVRLNPDASPN